MKRRTLAALLACASLSGACSDSEVQAGIAGLSGTYDLTLANGLVFVTSSDRDELRVLDLIAEPRQFIPAPNPLEALAIPVLDRPDALTHDDDFGSSGEAGVPYVYARSSGSQQISVVASSRDRLREVRRLDAGGLVTAFSARAPAGSRTTSVLYYALQTPPPPAPEGVTYPVQCAFGAIMRQELAGPDELAATAPAPAVPVFCLFERESAAALTVMPDEGRFVLATRSTTRLPPALPGRTLLITESVGGAAPQAPVDLSAGFGSPVRLVATHPALSLPDDPETPAANDAVVIPAGRYIYGVRDETACGGVSQCSGVLAVDTTSSPPGQLARDISGAPMFPIQAPAGLPTGLALIPDGFVRLVLNDGTGGLVRVPLLGIMPATNGTITLFPANALRHFDLDTAVTEAGTPQATSLPRFAAGLRNRLEGTVSLPDDDTDSTNASPVQKLIDLVVVTQNAARSGVFYEGSVPDAIYRIVYQGELEGLTGLVRDPADPRRFEGEAAAAAKARAGDLIVLEAPGAECETALPVTAVEPVPDTTRVRFAIDDATVIPETCAGLTAFTVRAGGTQPFVLINEAGSFLSRDVVGTSYSIPTDYFFHPTGFYIDDDGNRATPPVPNIAEFPQPPPPLLIQVSSVGTGLQRGDRYLVVVSSGVRTYVTRVNTGAASLTLYTLPGPVAAPPGSGLAYIAYPSADGVLQVNMEVLLDNASNAAALTPFE